MRVISNPDNEGVVFSVESDTKNQNKTTSNPQFTTFFIN